MATKKTTTADAEVITEVVEEAVVEETTEDVAETKYRYSAFRKNCKKLFGISLSTFDGATNKLDKDGEYTKSEMTTTIDTWKKGVTKHGRRDIH